jgi:glycine cleavage system aminomethyltransferase T
VAVEENPGILLYTRIRKSPYFDASRQHGVRRYSVYNHTYHPRHYGDPVREYWTLLEGVTLWDVGVERQIEISGPDAFTFTNMMTPRDLSKCAVRQAKYAFITLPDGGIANDPVLLRLEENRFWLSLADSDIGLWAQGLAYHSGLDVTIGEVDVAPVQIQGPKSREVMAGLFGEEILEIPYYHMSEDLQLDGMRVCVSRTGYTGELGYEIYLHDATKNGARLWNTVLEAGRPHGLEVIGPCHIRRIEGGILAFGCDMWYDTNPFEVGMGYTWMVDLDQEADFVGKEALRRIKAEGPGRKLVGIEIEGPSVGTYIDNEMIDMYPVLQGGEQVGKVTSACHSPRLEANIGYAMLPAGLAEPLGQEFEVETPTGRRRGVTVRKPFIDPEKEIPKQ